ncbi:MAG TPA: PaaI family thioesterase [Mycobacteriales bacterium]|nr:PaaI family thioesterase [Mycobacteriales bacterium]
MTALPAEPPAAPTMPTLAGVHPLGIAEPAADKLGRSVPHYDGLDFLRAIQSGELPPPPVAELLGFEIVELAKGEVTFAMTPREEHYNAIGSVHGGVVATLLDTVMGCALHTLLPKQSWYTTLDINVRYHRGVTLQTGRVLATGTVTHNGRRTATAEARLVDAATRRLMATSTSSLLVVRP